MIQNKYKILVVEDEANIRNLVATVLDTAGYKTILAENCAMAETLFAVIDVDLVDREGNLIGSSANLYRMKMREVLNE